MWSSRLFTIPLDVYTTSHIISACPPDVSLPSSRRFVDKTVFPSILVTMASHPTPAQVPLTPPPSSRAGRHHLQLDAVSGVRLSGAAVWLPRASATGDGPASTPRHNTAGGAEPKRRPRRYNQRCGLRRLSTLDRPGRADSQQIGRFRQREGLTRTDAALGCDRDIY